MKNVYRVENSPAGKNLKQIREDTGLNQRDFAESLKVAASTICEIEAGNSNPGYGLLMQLYQVYNVNPNYILIGVGGPYFEKTPTTVNDFDFGEQQEEIVSLIRDMERSPILRYTTAAYVEKFRLSHSDIIDLDISLHSKRTGGKKTGGRKRKNKK